jgi:hypothetical protein
MGAHDREFRERFTAEFVREFPALHRELEKNRDNESNPRAQHHGELASSSTDGIEAVRELDALVTLDWSVRDTEAVTPCSLTSVTSSKSTNA